jgi:hypothetical protein
MVTAGDSDAATKLHGNNNVEHHGFPAELGPCVQALVVSKIDEHDLIERMRRETQ